MWKTIAGKKLTEKQAIQLIEKGKTNKIKGFKNKAGKKFDASLLYSI
ncbi:topoisomerase C-terminal repeat-containing protein [Clostridium algoriphilum]|nr:topoisomerase C-terminal repeat-containing protein [Clostridium algoriphilum]MCB2295720.1 topoisomerase C-terminal repeat-containing protein [Clostridium algoriphilum]